MRIKRITSLIFLMVIGCSQALAHDFSYKSNIPADNKASEEYLKKRDELDNNNWQVDKLARENALAEKRAEEAKKYTRKDDSTAHFGFSYDLDNQKMSFPYHAKDWTHTGDRNRASQRKCYRETRQKLEKERGNAYSNTEISDVCGGNY
ncbi:hypothetical protein [Xenorhabdus innexi]|uniref:Uncharacterized protein n=1 Tax=Xenorhabdus innexi TaxID=290109 RepID=A0A1N6MW22_9GAMM|nr:hypothetical protein [Xenorhabdus innexi]PHM37531.1 hypothetical protein Xinn_00916 [Xenorhabdus innexi]SIP72987.1 conserved exported hypothetical protein [Xenorhabdus innexi]